MVNNNINNNYSSKIMIAITSYKNNCNYYHIMEKGEGKMVGSIKQGRWKDGRLVGFEKVRGYR